MKKEDTGLDTIYKPRGQGHTILKFSSPEARASFEQTVATEKSKCKNRRVKLKPVTKPVDARQEKDISLLLEKQAQAQKDRFIEPTQEDREALGA